MTVCPTWIRCFACLSNTATVLPVCPTRLHCFECPARIRCFDCLSNTDIVFRPAVQHGYSFDCQCVQHEYGVSTVCPTRIQYFDCLSNPDTVFRLLFWLSWSYYLLLWWPSHRGELTFLQFAAVRLLQYGVVLKYGTEIYGRSP